MFGLRSGRAVTDENALPLEDAKLNDAKEMSSDMEQNYIGFANIAEQVSEYKMQTQNK